MTILLVEDHPDDAFLTSRALQKANIHRVIVKQHGKDALNFLRKRSSATEHADESFPDLIIVDINLPVMNGFEMIREIRNDNKLRHIPLVVLSSSCNPKDMEICRELGVLDYLTKPPSTETFLKIFASLHFQPSAMTPEFIYHKHS